MSNQEFKHGDIIPIDAEMEEGAIPVVFIRRLNNDFWDGLVWSAVRVSVGMVPVANDPNFYKYLFDTAVGDAEDTYVINPVNENENATQDNAVISATVTAFFNTLTDKVSRVLGLNHENINIKPLTYDPNNNEPLTSIVKTYDSAVNALAGSVTGLQETYDVLSEFDAEGKLVSFIQTRVVS